MDGHIVRFLFKDFMTYSSVESYPHKHLNIISGGNGTGKSSVFNGILFGLNGKTTFVNRAKSIGDFIKHGKDKSYIEIELFNSKGCNHVISRTIYPNSSSTWTLNGKKASQKEVQDIVEKLHIQVDNLCQFLPQDRVADFARMNHQELLENTEKAVGDPQLYANRQKLKLLYTQMEDVTRQAENVGKNIEGEIAKNGRLEQEVENFHNKRQFMQKIELMKKKISWLTYKKAKEDLEGCRAEVASKQTQFDSVGEGLKAKNELVHALKGRLTSVDGEKVKLHKRIGDISDRITVNRRNMRGWRDGIAQAQQEYEIGVNNIQITENNVKTLKEEIGNLETQMGHEKKKFELSQDELIKLSEQRKRLAGQISSNRDQVEKAKRVLEDMAGKKNRTVKEIESHQSKFNEKLALLKRQNPDAFAAYNWLQSNRHTFKDKVIGPLTLYIDIKQEGLNYLETQVSAQDWLGFITYNQHDFVQFTKIRKRMNLKIAIFMERSLPPHLHPHSASSENDQTSTMYLANQLSHPPTAYINSTYAPSVKMEKYAGYGFICYLKDYVVSAPLEVMSFLCRKYRIHDVPVGGAKVRQNLVEVGKQLSLSTYYARELRVTVIKSRYRPDEPCFNQQKIRDSPNLLRLCAAPSTQHLSDSEDVLARLEESLQAMEDEMKVIVKEVEILKGREGELEERVKEVNKEMQDLSRHKNTQNIIGNKLKSTRLRLEKEECNLKSLDELKIGMDKKIRALMDKMNIVDTNWTLHLEREALQDKLVRVCLKSVKEESRLAEISNEVDVLKLQYQQLKEEKDEADSVFQLSLQRYKKCLDVVKSICVMVQKADILKLLPQIEQEFKEFPDQISSIEDQILDMKARADLLVVGESVVEEYYKRKEEIEAMGAEARHKAAEVDKISKAIVPLRETWLGALKELVHKINSRFVHYFARIDCVGQIVLLEPADTTPPVTSKRDKETPHNGYHAKKQNGEAADSKRDCSMKQQQPCLTENFQGYGLSIDVKFRQDDKMQSLNHKHQSGGERSVSTIFFLLALQELTFCPFRMVDEINQGMDHLNEAKVLELIVELSSKPHVPQYFLLTPKLLQNTKFGSYTKFLVLIRTKVLNEDTGENATNGTPEDGVISIRAAGLGRNASFGGAPPTQYFSVPVEQQHVIPNGGVIVKTEKRIYENNNYYHDMMGSGDESESYPLIDITEDQDTTLPLPRAKIARRV